MRGQVALVHEQGQDFAILLVKPSALRDPAARDDLLRFCASEFGVRGALLADDGATWGPPDIVNWLRGVPAEALPWRDFWMEN
jgi:hypothetical protein